MIILRQNYLENLRVKLDSLEIGFAIGMCDASELKQEADELLHKYPDMPTAERERTEALKLAVEPTRGRVS